MCPHRFPLVCRVVRPGGLCGPNRVLDRAVCAAATVLSPLHHVLWTLATAPPASPAATRFRGEPFRGGPGEFCLSECGTGDFPRCYPHQPVRGVGQLSQRPADYPPCRNFPRET